MTTSAKLKITARSFADRGPFIRKNGRPKYGDYCRACGAPLKDEQSIQRGYGRCCWKNVVIQIVIEIPAEETTTEVPS